MEPIIFGGALHSSGWMSAYDGPPRQGAITAVRVLNEGGGIMGHPVEWIELDGQTDVATLGNITLQLIDQGADAILAPCDFDMGAAAGQAAQESGIVAMSTCASSPLYGSEALGDLNFTMSMWNTTMGAAAAEFAYNDQGWRTAYVMTDTTIEYDTSLADYFIETFEKLGGEVLAEDEFLQDDPDISALIQRFQEVEDEVDVLFISSYMPGVGAAIRQVRSAGIDTPLMGGDS
jgi:branched-chain amino acid transport system substrate-binding protein